jgi:hypothetical protein
MATPAQVFMMLIPDTQLIMTGLDYEGIEFISGKTITKDEYKAGFAQYDAWKAEQEATAAADKASATAKLEALGLTADDLKALGL